MAVIRTQARFDVQLYDAFGAPVGTGDAITIDDIEAAMSLSRHPNERRDGFWTTDPVKVSAPDDGAFVDDLLHGGEGDDHLDGGLGRDTLEGGAGSDYALFSGNAADYTLTRGTGSASNQVTVVGADGTDLLIDVEYFRFDDTDLNIWGL